jgi:hypothetical protein
MNIVRHERNAGTFNNSIQEIKARRMNEIVRTGYVVIINSNFMTISFQKSGG